MSQWMMGRRSGLLPFAAAVGVVILCAEGHARQSLEARVDAIVEQFMTEEPSAGLAVAVMRGDAVLLAKGYGYADLEHRVPATADTVFRIASVSKQFAAVATLSLAEQGRLDLDAPISRYFPEFPTDGPVPTVVQLLDHTSGVAFDTVWQALVPPSAAPVDVPWGFTGEELSSLFGGATFGHAPGQRFRYNNPAYEVVALLIERLTGMSYPAFLQRHLWDPAGMTSTYYIDTARVIPHRAHGYTLREGEIINAPYRNLNANVASGALGSTVRDLMKWQRALLTSRLIGSEMTSRMRTRGVLADGTPTPYGLGLFLLEMEGREKIDHYGNMTGTRAQLAYYPSADLSVSVLANMNPLRTDVLESRISRMLLDIPERVPSYVEVPADRLQAYAGDYVVTDAPISHRSVTVSVSYEAGSLWVGRFALRPVGAHTFVPEGDPYHHYTFSVRDGVPVGLEVVRESRVIADATRLASTSEP